MTDPVLTIDGLSVRFPGATAVEDVSLALLPDEVLAVVGESGSGKSVTALAVLGLLPPGATATGSVAFDGQELLGLDEEALRRVRGARIALVFQEPSTALNPVERVGWQIGEVLRAHGVKSRQARAERVGELLGQVGIPPERARDYPHQFSGGQKQRIVLALALAADPDVLIADEPTTALDVTVQAEILALLRELQRGRRLAVLLITHNMGVVADLADRVAVMRDGRVLETQDVRRLFAAPSTEYARELLASVPRLGRQGRAVRPATEAAPVFAVDDLVVDYPGRKAALDRITLAVTPGEVLGLVGESGSGKTTLGRVAVGRLGAASGTVRLFGTDLAGLGRRELRALRKRIGVVHQDPAASLDPRRTVLESITEPLDVHRVGTPATRVARAEELLEQVALGRSYGSRLPRELSGGQRQRVALARALALEPDLLLADEPTSALDVSVQASVLELFAELQEAHGFACLFISHDLAVVNQVADRVAVMRNGQLVESGPTGEVLTRPSSAYTRALVDSVPVPDPDEQRARRLPTVLTSLKNTA
ncbi:ABC transporter ATP-binding protein [Actinocorallia sp. API 0066]|uniref:dipeptide ABC transporter ATP-binding protein n=1 Tax=Actinocorallia sp. API 0066 TaxID=2896846 RepID=UPI001E640CFE|nr:ABC transporter ATP-binding protein [Actinocorallia sp. API 0066]MCD0450506.1 ABC transporter ATP-binding protein [Actinocorallia sp. API 0066]